LQAGERSGRPDLLIVGISPEVLALVDPFNLCRVPSETTTYNRDYISSVRWRVHGNR
jgi:hypothetical protein